MKRDCGNIQTKSTTKANVCRWSKRRRLSFRKIDHIENPLSCVNLQSNEHTGRPARIFRWKRGSYITLQTKAITKEIKVAELDQAQIRQACLIGWNNQLTVLTSGEFEQWAGDVTLGKCQTHPGPPPPGPAERSTCTNDDCR